MSSGEQSHSESLAKLDTLLQKAVNVLLKVKTVFPFDLFPDTLIIDHNKVDIIYKHFFGTSETISIPIDRINHVSVNSTLFLSSLKIEVKGMEKNPTPLTKLTSHDAHLAKDLLLGLMGAHAEGINLSQLSGKDVIDTLVRIGKSI